MLDVSNCITVAVHNAIEPRTVVMALADPPAPYNFEGRLKEASAIMGVPIEELMSIKLRPITDAGGFETEYLGGTDYEYINKELGRRSFACRPRR